MGQPPAMTVMLWLRQYCTAVSDTLDGKNLVAALSQRPVNAVGRLLATPRYTSHGDAFLGQKLFGPCLKRTHILANGELRIVNGEL